MVSIDFLEKSIATFVQNRKCQGVNHTAPEFISLTSLGKGKNLTSCKLWDTSGLFLGDVRWMGSGSDALAVRRPSFRTT